MSSRYLAIIVVAISILAGVAFGQNICQNCLNSTNNFVCNNLGCQGFAIESSNQQNYNQNSVMCNQVNGSNGGTGCFYLSSLTSTTVTYMFCNASISGCATCLSGASCSSCYNGFYLYTYNVTGNLQNCQSCSGSVPGCLLCSAQGFCTQCAPGYYSSNGTCYFFNQTQPLGMSPFTYQPGGSTSAQIASAVLIFLIIIFAFTALGIFFFRQKKQTPDFMNPNLYQTSIQQTITNRQ